MSAKITSLILLLLLIFLQIPTQSFAGGYTIAPGDKLFLLVLGQPQYNQVLNVRSDGKISYFYGDIQAAGRTTDELADVLKSRLANFIQNPVIVVSPVLRDKEIFVSGQVKLPNRYAFTVQQKLSILQALTMAGGIITQSADLRNVTLIREDGNVETYNLKEIQADKIVYLHSGDIVYVPELANIQVAGNVQNPGEFWVKDKVRVDYALALAGGPLQDEADLSNLIIYRANGENEKISVTDEFWKVEDKSENNFLHNGDILYVPNAYKTEKINVLGYVHSPGAYKIRKPLSPLEAIALAGGAIMERANLRKVSVRKADGRIQLVDMTLYYKDAQSLPDIKLYPGDTLEIPKQFQFNWSLLLSLLSIVSITVSLARR